jgi:integrase
VACPINDTLLAELERAHAHRASRWVVEWGGGRVHSIKHGFRDACARARLERVTPHTLRHTAATWMAQAGVPLWEIAGILGNTVQMVETVYGHHSPDHLRRAARALG